MKKVLALILFGFLFLITSCFNHHNPDNFEYKYDDPELYSVGAYSLLGAHGYVPDHHGILAPTINTLEYDNFGRVLFRYSEESHITGHSALVIMQKTDGRYAYFYPYNNFILSSSQTDVSDEDIEVFKALNSWNQELSNSDKFEKVEITRRKENGPISDRQLIEVYYGIFPYLEPSNRLKVTDVMIFLRSDNYGRSVYFAGLTKAVIFQADNSFDIENGTLLITEPNNYQTELKLFMEENGWNTPAS